MSGAGHIECPFSLVVIVASVGGLDATGGVLERLPPDFSASVAVVQHRLPHPDYGVELLGRRCALPVEAMRDGTTPRPGRVYLAPALGQALIDDAGASRSSAPTAAAATTAPRACARSRTRSPRRWARPARSPTHAA